MNKKSVVALLINKAIKIAGTNILVANIILNRFAASISFTIFSGIGAFSCYF